MDIYDIVNTDNEAYGLLDNNQGIKLNGGIEDYPVSRDRINVNDASAQAFKGQEVSNTGDRLYIYQDNTVQAFNNLTGDFLWQYDAQGKIYDIGVDQGIYIITDNNGFIQLNSDGEVVVARQHNVFDFSDRTIDNYPQLLSGKKKTEENVSFSEQDFYPPDIPYYEYQDTVFVLSEDSHILALNSQDGDIRWTIEQDDSLSVKLDPRSDRGGLYVSNIRQVNRGLTEKINPQNGNALWSYGDKYTQDCSFSMYQIRDYCWYNSTITDVSYDGDRLYMYINAIDNPQITEGILVSLDTETGLEQWEKISSDFVMEDPEKIYLQEGAVIWSGQREELMGHKIYAQIRSGNTFNLLQIDGKTGGIDWERSLADEVITHNQHIIPDVDLRYIYLLEMNKQGNNNQDTTVGIRVIDTEDGSNEDLYAQRSLLPDNVNDEEGNYLPESLYQQNTLYADHEFNIYWHTKHGQESEYFSGIYSIFRPDGDMNWMFDFRTGAQSSDGFFGKVEQE